MAVQAISKALSNAYDIISSLAVNSVPALQKYASMLQSMGKELAETQTPTLEELQGRVTATSATLLELSTKASNTAVGFFLRVQAQYWAQISDTMIEDPNVVLTQLEDEHDWLDIKPTVKAVESKAEDEWVEVDISFAQIFINLGINDQQTQTLLTRLISQKKGWEFLDETTRPAGKVPVKSVKTHVVFSLATLLYQEDLETFCKHIQNFPLTDDMVKDFAFSLYETEPTFLCIYLENFISGHHDLRDVFSRKIREDDIYLFCNYLPKFGYQTEEEYYALALEVAAQEPEALCDLFHHFPIDDSEKVLVIVHRLAASCFNMLARNFSKFIMHQLPGSSQSVTVLSNDQRWAVVARYREVNAEDICSHIAQFQLSGSDRLFDLSMYLVATAPEMLVQKLAHFPMEQGQYKGLVSAIVKKNAFLLIGCLKWIPIEDEAFLYKTADYLARKYPYEFYQRFAVNFRTIAQQQGLDIIFEYRLTQRHRQELAYVVACLILEKGIMGTTDEDVYDVFGFPGRGIADRLLNEPLQALLHSEDPVKKVAEWKEDS